ncbi:hypothetical protein [Bacillus altitudinis]|uniref:hypothetical protein n=1 Tax=Bacillus altitudinis TaxID=293387 RepID=UPI001F39EE2B|nr:hypothetical protein [Bacillus altitudinis]
MKTNKTIICALTKKDVYLFFFYDLFIATLAYYMFKIKPTMFYECLGDNRKYSLSIVDEKVEVEVIFSSHLSLFYLILLNI